METMQNAYFHWKSLNSVKSWESRETADMTRNHGNPGNDAFRADVLRIAVMPKVLWISLKTIKKLWKSIHFWGKARQGQWHDPPTSCEEWTFAGSPWFPAIAVGITYLHGSTQFSDFQWKYTFAWFSRFLWFITIHDNLTKSNMSRMSWEMHFWQEATDYNLPGWSLPFTSRTLIPLGLF